MNDLDSDKKSSTIFLKKSIKNSLLIKSQNLKMLYVKLHIYQHYSQRLTMTHS